MRLLRLLRTMFFTFVIVLPLSVLVNIATKQYQKCLQKRRRRQKIFLPSHNPLGSWHREALLRKGFGIPMLKKSKEIFEKPAQKNYPDVRVAPLWGQ